MRMSAHNRVIWSEGLFLQPQHFQQQERYFERYVETRCQAARPAQLGLHRDRVRTRFSEHRQGRAAAWRGRVPRRHAVPDARRRSAADADRHRTGRPRSDSVSRGAAAPRRRARRRAGMRARTNWCGMTCARCRRAMRRRAEETRRCSKWGRCARGCCWRATSRQAYACVPLAHVVECRADKQVVLDDNFIPTVLHVRPAGSAGGVYHRAARARSISVAKRSPGASRRPAGARRPSSPTS